MNIKGGFLSLLPTEKFQNIFNIATDRSTFWKRKFFKKETLIFGEFQNYFTRFSLSFSSSFFFLIFRIIQFARLSVARSFEKSRVRFFNYGQGVEKRARKWTDNSDVGSLGLKH